MFKKLKCGIMALLVCSALLSGCGDSPPSDSVTETVTEQTTVETTAKYTEEELEQMAQNMPEIVFVMSHHYYYNPDSEYNTNILGFFITNTGEIKMYDFRQIAADEIYEIPDVYDRLEEATCSEITPKIYWNESSYQEELLTQDKLGKVNENDLIQYYKKLLCSNENIELIAQVETYNIGYYQIYGIRNNDKGEKEFVLLGDCSSEYMSKQADPETDKLFSQIYSIFPKLPNYNG